MVSGEGTIVRLLFLFTNHQSLPTIHLSSATPCSLSKITRVGSLTFAGAAKPLNRGCFRDNCASDIKYEEKQREHNRDFLYRFFTHCFITRLITLSGTNIVLSMILFSIWVVSFLSFLRTPITVSFSDP